MSGVDDILACCGLCAICCCIADCMNNNSVWCVAKCCPGGTRYRVKSEDGWCSCRRTMDDKEFERTVEELYAPDRPVELQPRAKRSQDAPVDTQPAARPSMEARLPSGPREGETDEERDARMRSARDGAKGRTRDWIEQQQGSVGRSSSSGGDAGRRRPSDVRIASTTLVADDTPMPMPQPQPPQRQMSGESRASAHSQGRSLDMMHGVEMDDDKPQGPPRADIPTALMPGKGSARKSVAPALPPLDFGPPGQEQPARTPIEHAPDARSDD